MRIVCAGLATVDLVYRVDRIPGPDEKVQAVSMETAAGGPATNAAVTAAALGADVTLVTAVGAHPLGDLIRADLDRCNVRLLDAAPDSPEPPPVSAVTVLAGAQRTIVSRNAGDARVGVPDGLDVVLRNADAVLIDGHHPLLAAAAARAGRPLVVDAGSRRAVFDEAFPRATVVACSAAFPMTAEALLATGARHVAVTHGPEPVRWWSGDAAGPTSAGQTSPGQTSAGQLEVPPVAAVDTAGAGDVFHGALAVAVAGDPAVTDLVGALRFAIAVAGVRVAHAGPRGWLNAVTRGRFPAPS